MTAASKVLDTNVAWFAAQAVLAGVRRAMAAMLRTAEDFREEASPVWAPRVGAALSGAHFLEQSLAEAEGPLLLLHPDADGGPML